MPRQPLQTKNNDTGSVELSFLKARGLEALGLFFLTIAVFFWIALYSYTPQDPGWSYVGETLVVQNQAGEFGAWIADFLHQVLGYGAHFAPIFAVIVGIRCFRRSYLSQANPATKMLLNRFIRALGIFVLLTTFCIIAALHMPDPPQPSFGAGGLVGAKLAAHLVPKLSAMGTTLLAISFCLISLTFVAGISWLKLTERIGAVTLALIAKLHSATKQFIRVIRDTWVKLLTQYRNAQSVKKSAPGAVKIHRHDNTEKKVSSVWKKLFFWRREITSSSDSQTSKTLIEHANPVLSESAAVATEHQSRAVGIRDVGKTVAPTVKNNETETVHVNVEPTEDPLANAPWKAAKKDTVQEAATQGETDTLDAPEKLPSRKKLDTTSLPPLSILPMAEKSDAGYSAEELETLARLVEVKLKDFGIDARVVGVYPGPVITRFELDLAPGVKVSRISNLAKDLARSLSVMSVRIVEVIPGKSFVGLELPNLHREMVRLREVLADGVFSQSKSVLTMALGKDIAGKPVVADLAKMPHLLVAGTTGSGKSVGLNAMLLSLLYKATPEEVRLILIDPKMLELAVYEGIPHLLAPVVTDMKDAANALRWAVAEMERRYQLMAALRVRNITGYNQKIKEAEMKGETILDPLWNPTLQSLDNPTSPPALEKLPYIVVVVDEFADMMMIVGKKVEELIARIAQKARAAGIHLLLATQRPSVDVITGLIKANIPTRIAFQVSSKVDSRTILDQPGAEQLLGQGDMLHLPPGTGVPHRVHGAFVSDEEVLNVVADWKARSEPDYDDAIINGNHGDAVTGMTSDDDGGEKDPLYDEAVQFVTETRKASISGVQRKLKIGYNRAARMVEEMEQAGVVTEMQSNGSREVLAPPPV